MSSVTLADIAAILNVPLPSSGDARASITGVATLADATPAELSFLGSDRYLAEFATTRAAAVIVQKRVRVPRTPGRPIFVVEDADLAVAKVLTLFHPKPPDLPRGIDPRAAVAPSAQVHDTARIGPNDEIGQRDRFARTCVIHAAVY
jgi:UDP-3-O-[3-hydroxymyristoyl] glucosamine N-acyltransferase